MVSDTPNIAVALKVYLEGAFADGELNNELNPFLPAYQPYHIYPWNYPGLERALNMPADITDWVLVEIRETPFQADSAGSSAIVSQQAGLINREGNIVSIDGISPLTFAIDVTQNLYAVIRHRNHLSIMNAQPLTGIGGIYTYDFTDSETKVFGGNTGYKELLPFAWGMVAGDADGNGNIEISDKTGVWNFQAGMNGYRAADMNLNGQTDQQDKNDLWLPNLSKISGVPE
jgi:hypothetical protein